MTTSEPQVVRIHDAAMLARYFARDRELHIYELGDLDPFFWPQTAWWGLCDASGELAAALLLYGGLAAPTLLALGRDERIGDLLERVEPALPAEFYAHTSPGAGERLASRRHLVHRGWHHKMTLRDTTALASAATHDIAPLGPEHLDELRGFYERAHPQNWFDPRMLETGQYLGLREGERLVCAGGVHVYSSRHRVAALGNIATDPGHRGRGLATRLTALLCRRLLPHVDTIGLNVSADNAAAITCYRRLGFDHVARYDEWRVSPSST